MSSKLKVLIHLPLFPFGNNKFVSLHFFLNWLHHIACGISFPQPGTESGAQQSKH